MSDDKKCGCVKMEAREVITNYYTGERWYLVSIDGHETYVNEKRYIELKKVKSRD